jgi:RNA polymerase sigma-70 factor, ECF subfamily
VSQYALEPPLLEAELDIRRGADVNQDYETRFNDVVAGWLPALQRLAAVYEFSPETREELVQDILLAVWRSLPSFREESSLRTWVYRIAHNVAASHVAKAKRGRVGQAALEEIATQSPSTALLDVEARSEVRELNAFIRTLKSIDQQIILLSLEELPQDEIASITGVSPSNVSTRMHRIRTKLEAHFDTQGSAR